jgi:hypothetical protein
MRTTCIDIRATRLPWQARHRLDGRRIVVPVRASLAVARTEAPPVRGES